MLSQNTDAYTANNTAETGATSINYKMRGKPCKQEKIDRHVNRSPEAQGLISTTIIRDEVADIDVLKEGYLELKEDNKRLHEQITALIAASKRVAENKRILDDTEPPLASA